MSNPSLINSNPSHQSTGFAIGGNIVLNFSEEVVSKEGTIEIRKTSDNSSFESFDVTTNTRIAGSGTSTITIDPEKTLEESTSYYLYIPNEAFDDLSGASFSERVDKSTFLFTTEDLTSPTFSSAATNTAGTKVILTYNEALSATTASTTAFAVTTGGTSNSVTDATVSGSTVELTLTTAVKNDEAVTVTYTDPSGSNDANAIQDSEGNDVVDLASTSVTNNSTVAGTAPTISSLSPADDATAVATTSNIVLNFSEAVDVETGNIVIYKASDDSVVETIDVTSSQVTGTGSTQITINPSSDLAESTSYYVQIAATVFDDSSSNSYAGISDKTSLSFTTADETAPTITGPSGSEAGASTSSVSINENGTAVNTFEANETVTWSLNGGADASLFSINSSSGALSFSSAPDYEAPGDSDSGNDYVVNVRATDSAGNISDQTVTVSVNDCPELNVTSHQVGTNYHLEYIKDYDGNLHANNGSVSDATKTSYKYQGLIDVNADGTKEAIYTNKESGRWVTGSINSSTGEIDFCDHGQGGTTRVVGIYIDPLVTSGEVVAGSDHDSQRRFQNDLEIDNLLAKKSGDYDGDGFQEVYWKTVDGTAYLRALMHADGNIQFANYQSESQMSDYLTTNGYESTVSEITS